MFENTSDEDLQAELDRREENRRKKAIPQQLSSPDFIPLQEICQNYIDELAAGCRPDDDCEHYVFEAAIECCFGKDVWNWINRQY